MYFGLIGTTYLKIFWKRWNNQWVFLILKRAIFNAFVHRWTNKPCISLILKLVWSQPIRLELAKQKKCLLVFCAIHNRHETKPCLPFYQLSYIVSSLTREYMATEAVHISPRLPIVAYWPDYNVLFVWPALLISESLVNDRHDNLFGCVVNACQQKHHN